jgi:hypothetical protein
MVARHTNPQSDPNRVKGSEYERAQHQQQRYEYCRDNGHIAFSKKARMCDEFFAGDQWDAATKQRLARQRRPAMTFNKVLPAVAAILGEQLSAMADIGFKPAKDGTMETAEALNKVYIQIANQNAFTDLESGVFADGVITSRGFFDARMDFDDNVFGEVRIKTLHPRNVIIDPDADEYDPDAWKDVFLSRWLTPNDIELLYSKRAAEQVKTSVPSSNSYMGYDYYDPRPGTFGGEQSRTEETPSHGYGRYRILERQYRMIRSVDHFIDMNNGDVRRISPDMPREKIQLILEQFDVAVVRKRVEDIHWRVTCNDIVLHDERSPYKHFTLVPFFPFFRHGTTTGLVENMIDPQEAYNKARSQELHVINTTANSGWQAEEGQLVNMDDEELEERGAETGLVLIRKKGTQPLDKINPNMVPTGLDRISFTAAEDLKEVSMASDSMRGFDRADVAAKAIQAKQAQGSSNFAPILQNLNMTRRMLARNVLDMVQTFYTEPRVLQITGGVDKQQMQEITINEVSPEGEVARDLTVGTYDVVITSVPARETFEESQFQQAVQLKELGVAIPDQVLVANSHLSDKSELLELMDPEAGGPTEEEQALAKLEVEIKQLEAQKLDAESKELQSKAAYNIVKAQTEASPAAPDQVDPVDQLELAKAKHAYEKDMADLELERYKIDQDLEMAKAKLELEREALDIKRREVTLKAANEATKLRVQERAQATAEVKLEVDAEAGDKDREQKALDREAQKQKPTQESKK